MRTRKSRLFIVLLHLVGVSTDLPWTDVNPNAIVLERLPSGLDEQIRQDNTTLSDPFWLQAESDGLCLTPTGFSSCGDATLWYVRSGHHQTLGKRRRRKAVLHYALEASDGTCLVASGKNKRSLLARDVALDFGSCYDHLERVFAWQFTEEGILYNSVIGRQKKGAAASQQCLWRVNETKTALSHCHPLSAATSRTDSWSSIRRLALLALVRHQSAELAIQRAANRRELKEAELATATAVLKADGEPIEPEQIEEKLPSQENGIMRSRDLAHSHASEPLHRAELKSSKKHVVVRGSPTASPMKYRLSALHDTNPILFVGDRIEKARMLSKPKTFDRNSLAHSPPGTNDASYKLRRMQTHPYLAVAKNEVWTDPQTGLAFPTDLSRYLGHETKSAGRHTLTGVGYYTKTVLKIKVYGVALYVSKRDVLADPTFEQYAALTSEELRQKPNFYEHLRQMPSPHDPSAGLVDRTLFLKLNMQLSVETMVSSLQTSWKLLTEERKDLLINSSMKPREADEGMLKTIQRPDNPGRCSCGQVAPQEFSADRECCARGTELVFTWRKNGDLEIRVDGRVMDIFPRPDVAKGIFFEYLRTDDPISSDFIERVVDGWPFLLGPLSQVQGMPHPINMNDLPSDSKGLSVGKTVGVIAETMSSHAGDFAAWVHNGASGAANNLANAAKAFGDSAKSVGEGFDRRRDKLWAQVSSFPESGRMFLNRHLSREPDELAASVANYIRRKHRGEIQAKRRAVPRGRVFRSSLHRWFGDSVQDEHISSTTDLLSRVLFLYMTHMYLLLLLIVSLPGTHQMKSRRPPSRSKSVEIIDPDDASTASSSAGDDETSVRRSFPSDDTWSIGNESLGSKMKPNLSSLMRTNEGNRFGLVLSRARQTRRCVRGRSEDDLEIENVPSSSMKKSPSYFL